MKYRKSNLIFYSTFILSCFASTLGYGWNVPLQDTEYVTDEWKNLSEKEKRRYETKEEEREVKKSGRKRRRGRIDNARGMKIIIRK
ncbi:hypothetical protein AGMMS49921_11650 [Endomicrobiia bacterium]|nr:hypothetical protein AGMMS49921_11650 [Endomicrobiia bacterium]